ncbi:MAG: hypothetical protein GSR85_06810 [Desulfurococcales archaeon]|nr:hypothetical protein [Desulfurococcales archaeon]
MSRGLIIEEEYFDTHYRVVKIDDGDTRLYSIDYYMLLESRPEQCSQMLSLGGIKLCYAALREHCMAVILSVNGRVELVNLRLKTSPNSDPAGGSPAKAREICIEELESVAWLD